MRCLQLVVVFVALFFLFALTNPVKAYPIPGSITLPNSDMVVSKNNIVAIPYIMYDWENCNPETLKRGTNPSVDCWSDLTNVEPLPANRPPFAAGSFGSNAIFLWDRLQTGPSTYDWSSLDQYLQLAASMRVKDAQGNILPFKPVIVTFAEFLETQTGSAHDGRKDFTSYIPEFVKTSLPADQLTISLPNCDVQDMVPYHNSVFQTAYRQFIEAALAHLRQSPHGYVVQGYLMSGGLSSETHPHKNYADCAYGTYYNDRYRSAYVEFVNSSLTWTSEALRHGTTQPDTTAFLQMAAAYPNERYQYFRTAYPLGIGFKANGMSPSNNNAVNARPRQIGLYDAVTMTELNWPKGFEPANVIRTPSDYRCASRYCDSDARYQATFWMNLATLSFHADMFDMQRENLLWRREFAERFNLTWFYGFLENSLGKAANQSRVAWIAFADRLIDADSYPIPRPSPPLTMGTGDYYPAEFTERGDRDFYLYRLGENEDSSLIRQQAGVIPTTQNNYALSQNSCYISQSELTGQSNKILSGQDLRSSGKLDNSQFNHPFSATALSTDGGQGKTQISLVLEEQVASIRNSSAVITVEYLDAGTDQFALEFTNPQGQVQQELVTKTNTKQWKSFQVTKSPAQISWQHRLTGGADLRLNCLCSSATGDDIFSMVRIEAQSSPLRVTASNTLDFCGEPTGGGCSGSPDVNQDGTVNLIDLSAVITHLGSSGASPYDVNCDQTVNLLDFTSVVSHLSI